MESLRKRVRSIIEENDLLSGQESAPEKAVKQEAVSRPFKGSFRKRNLVPEQSFLGPDLKKAVESLLFASGKAMTEKEICELTGGTPKKVRNSLEELQKDYDSRDTSITLMQTNDAWKMNVKEKYVTLVTKIVADTELPFPVLETLSVIAFKAPVMQAEVIKIRGTNAYEHIGVLIEGGFVEKRKKGRSFDLGLTQKCYDYFDVQGDRSLKEVLKEAKKPDPDKVPKKLGELPVVDVPEPPKDDNKLGELQIVEMENQTLAEPKPAINSNRPDDDFLSKIENQINSLSKRNDEHDEDELFKRSGGEDENPEGALPSEGNSKTDQIFGDHSADSEEEKKEGGEELSDKKEEKEPAEEDEEEEDEEDFQLDEEDEEEEDDEESSEEE